MLHRIILTTISFFVLHALSAQSDSLQKQINEQVWKPFIKSFTEMDTDGFMAVHSKNMSRVEQDGKRIYGFDKYYADSKTGNERSKTSGRKRNIELRFIQRIAASDRGFEVGYYKTTSINPDGTSRSFYGKFHVLLQKENGVWKIVMDADAHENTDEAVFQAAQPLE
jgi:ketosteroid isomerase-like protein